MKFRTKVFVSRYPAPWLSATSFNCLYGLFNFLCNNEYYISFGNLTHIENIFVFYFDFSFPLSDVANNLWLTGSAEE